MTTPNLDKPAHTVRPSMRPKSLSVRVRSTQARLTRKPAKITLAMPRKAE